jgi:flagellar protein FlaG
MGIEIQPRSIVLPASTEPVRHEPATETATKVAAPVAPKPAAELIDNSERLRHNLDAAIEHINTVMRDGGRNLSFSIDPALGRPIVVVRKEDTGEVIRQFPNEVVIKVAHSIEALKGVLLNKEI